MKIVNLYTFFFALFVLMLIPSPSVAIPLSFVADDVSGDVKLDDENYGSYTAGDIIPSAEELDINDVTYSFDDATGVITLIMELHATPVLNVSTIYSAKLSINRYEGDSSQLVEASINTAALSGSSSISMSFDDGSYQDTNVLINETIAGTSISWSYNISAFLPTSDIFVANTTSVILSGYTEHFPGTTDGSSNAKFWDEVDYQWPIITDDLTDEDKNALPFSVLSLIAIPIIGLFKRKLN